MPSVTDRAWIERLIFGQETARRFTQDSPVLPDVWIAFAEDPGARLDLLLTPNMEPTAPGGATTTGRLRKALVERLRTERGRPGAWCRAGEAEPPSPEVAHNQATVLAKL